MKQRFVVCVLLVGALGACNKKKDEPKPEPTVQEPKPDPTKPDPTKAKEPAPDPVARGSYVAEAAGCLTCHTAMANGGPDLANAGAGGLEMPDPAGTWRTPNITPDKASGIGNWTDDQIARSIREGVRPDGTQLYAIMPYENYNRMTDDDTKALVAFLRTLKPVERVVAPNKDLKIPKIPVGKPANAPDVTTDPVKHGEYLATLMLCSHCHWTPDPKTHGPMGPDKMFSGGLDMTIPIFGTGKLYAANITSDADTGIGKYTEDQLFTAIRTMVKPNSQMIRPPMLLLQGGWSQMDEKDLHAVAAYIKQLPAVKNKVPDSTFVFKPPGPPPATGSSGAGSGAGSAAAPTKIDPPKKGALKKG